MQRDILFFVRGIPPGCRIQSQGNVFMEPLSDQLHGQMYESAKGTQQVPTLERFLGAKPGGVILVGFRNDYPDEVTAVSRAWKCLHGIFDGMAFIIDGQKPEACAVVQLREGNAKQAKIMRYAPELWIQQDRAGSESPEKWKASRDALAKRLLVFYEVALGNPKYKNDLGYQIAYSARMFRCGNEVNSFGVEFLCKFSALEGLVCGSSQNKKHKLLTPHPLLITPCTELRGEHLGKYIRTGETLLLCKHF